MDGKERFKKMSAVTTINLLDLVDAIGEDETKNLLSDFSCSKNQELKITSARTPWTSPGGKSP